MIYGIALILLLLGVEFINFFRPSFTCSRFFIGNFTPLALLSCTALGIWGLLVVLTGAPVLSTVIVVSLNGALVLVSSVKRKVLGEPLVFTDFALIGAVFQHPHFYISALRPSQLTGLIAGFAAMLFLLALQSTSQWEPRLIGAGASLLAGGILPLFFQEKWGAELSLTLDLDPDYEKYGLIPGLLLYWRDWRLSDHPAACAEPAISAKGEQLVVIVQCESFTDPAELFGDPALQLQGLQSARRMAWRSGRLQVSGFGAYTMRTEYGVLFGRDEDELGVRRFDPFLTAFHEASWALPNRLDGTGWKRYFVHPHDMRFYGRDQIMPEAGFDALIGPESFAPPEPGEGRYVTDDAIADRILEIAQDNGQASFIYAVTIENHGPWSADKDPASGQGAPYLRLLRRSDAMLQRLLEALPKLERPVALCFFGDHRPSIPGISEPSPERHTPYALLRFSADGKPIVSPQGAEDVTPAELHHLIVSAIRQQQKSMPEAIIEDKAV